MRLSEDLQKWRAERPDEYTMDQFIKEATRLESVEAKFLQTNNSGSNKLPANVVEEFHRILRDRCRGLWSNERHTMDVVASFISRR